MNVVGGMKIGRLSMACGSFSWGSWTLKIEELIISVVCCEELIVRSESLGGGS